jgi:hypothetical protein
LLLLLMLHMVPSIQISLETLLSQIVETRVLLFYMHFSHFSVRNCEIFVETVGL